MNMLPNLGLMFYILVKWPASLFTSHTVLTYSTGVPSFNCHSINRGYGLPYSLHADVTQAVVPGKDICSFTLGCCLAPFTIKLMG